MRKLIYFLIVAISLPCGISFGQRTVSSGVGRTVTSCVVLPFTNATGHDDPLLPEKAAAAVALSLEGSREFVITSTLDLNREMAALGIRSPVSKGEQVRLGAALRVEKVLTGTISELSVTKGTGQARCSIEVKMLDVSVQDFLDGAVATAATSPIPGWSGDITNVVNDAMRAAAGAAVTQMIARRVRRGHVDLVTDRGEVNIGLGIGDGIQIGTELLVMRPTWSADLEITVMRRVGIVSVGEVTTDMAWGSIVEGSPPQTGDRVYKLYKPPTRQKAEHRAKSRKSLIQSIAAIALLLSISATGSGSSIASASELTGNLSQATCGAAPAVVLKTHTDNTERERTHGWVIYRAANNPYFPPTPYNMIDVIQGKDLPSKRYSDDPNLTEYIEDFEFTYYYFVEEGEQEEATATASWNHLPMSPGSRYFYTIRRIIEPLRPPGFNPPIATAQAEEPVDPTFELDVEGGSGLSEASNHFGPVTYFLPPQLSSPSHGAPNQDVANVRFTWQVTTGADMYRVELFGPTDPNGRGNLYWQSGEIRVAGGAATMSASFTAADPADGLTPDTPYYWRVGAWASGDATKPHNRDLNKVGYLYSQMWEFRTVVGPPGPLDVNKDTKPATRKPGFWRVKHGSVGR